MTTLLTFTSDEHHSSENHSISRYLYAHADALPLHHPGWMAVLWRTYRLPTRMLVSRDGTGAITGVLPLYASRIPFVGRRVATLPGGLVADNSAAASALVDGAKAWAREMRADSVTLQDTRQPWPSLGEATTQHVHWHLPTGGSSDAAWKALDGNIRRQVRKARRNGLYVESDRTGKLVSPFYTVFSRFCHAVGTPIFPRRFLDHIVERFPGGFSIVVVWHRDAPVAGYFQLLYRDTVYGMWGAALRDSLNLRSAYLGVWEVLRDAADGGFDFLDMGRSPTGSSASDFKKQWGGIASPVYQLNLPVTAQTAATPTTDGQFARWLQQRWPSLPPWAADRLGPRLRHFVPFA